MIGKGVTPLPGLIVKIFAQQMRTHHGDNGKGNKSKKKGSGTFSGNHASRDTYTSNGDTKRRNGNVMNIQKETATLSKLFGQFVTLFFGNWHFKDEPFVDDQIMFAIFGFGRGDLALKRWLQRLSVFLCLDETFLKEGREHQHVWLMVACPCQENRAKRPQ